MIYVCDEANQCEKRKECCIYDTVHKDEYGEVEMGLCFQKDKFVTFSMLAEEFMETDYVHKFRRQYQKSMMFRRMYGSIP